MTKNECAERMIQRDFELEPEITEIYRLISPNEDDPREPIKMLAVSGATLQAGRVMPYAFGPMEGSPYPTIMATVTPGEMRQIARGEISLPDGWNLATALRYQSPALVLA